MARIVDVRHWVNDGTPATTVTTRRWGRLYATTRFHRIDRRTRRYLPSDVLDQRVKTIGDWR